MLGRTKVGFAPYRPYPLFRRLAPWPFVWLGCWSADCTLTLDTRKEYRGSNSFEMVREYCEEINLLRLGQRKSRPAFPNRVPSCLSLGRVEHNDAYVIELRLRSALLPPVGDGIKELADRSARAQ